MTFRERLPTWLGGISNAQRLEAEMMARAATDAIAFHQTQSFGPGIGNQPTHDALLAANVGVSDTATRAIANRVSSLNPQVKVSRRDRQKGTLVDEILDDHPLKSLLDRPHPDFSRAMLLRLTAQWIVTVGEAYWLKVGSRLSVPMELHPIPPTQIHPVLSGGVISSYMVTNGDGRQKPLDRDNVIRFHFPDPENIHGAEGYLGPNGTAVDSYAFAGQHLRSHYEDDATPKTVLKALEGAAGFSTPEKERFYTEWRKHYHARLGTKKGLPAILPTNYDLVTMAVQSGADIVPLLEHWRDDQLMGMGVPRSILGQVVSGDRSSAETNQYVFDLHTVLPIAGLIEQGITLQLAPDFDASLFVEFEEFIAGDKRFNLEKQTADLRDKVRSVNQVREDDGLDPVEWGEEPVGKIGEMPYDPSMSYDPGDDDPAALGAEEKPKPKPAPQEKTAGKFDETEAITGSSVLNGAQVASIVTLIQNVATGLLQKSSAIELMGVAFGIDKQTAAKIIGDPKAPTPTKGEAEDRVRALVRTQRSAFFVPAAEWQRQLAREKAYVPSFLRAMRTIFRDQQASALKKLEATEPRSRAPAAASIFSPDEWVDLFEKRVEPIRLKAFETILGETLGGLGVDEFVFTDEMRFILKQQGALLVKHANRTTQNLIARQLEKATAEGEGIDQIAKRIKGVFAQRRKNHARTIARTEVLKASQEAQVVGFETSGVVEKKQWNTSMDGAVRDSHGGPGGTIDVPIVGLREAFNLDGELAKAPGVGAHGGQLSAGNSINCRCFVTPVLEE